MEMKGLLVMKNVRSLCAALSLVVPGALVLGNVPAGATTVPPDGDAGCTEDRAGGSVTMSLISEPLGLDPISIAGRYTGAIQLTALYDTLMRYDPATAEFEPFLAESLTSNDELTEWTLTLRPDIHFGSGNPLTADAVKGSIERFRLPESRVNITALIEQIDSIDVIDDLTLVIHTVAPFAGVPYMLAAEFGMPIDLTVAEAQGLESFALDPAGAGVGPFELDHFTPGDEIVMKSKDDYWGGPVCLDELRFITIPDEQTAYDAFSVDEIQAAYFRSPRFVRRLVDEDEVPHYTNILFGGRDIHLNTADGITSDVRIRRAIAAAINLDVVNERGHDGALLIQSSIVNPDSPLYPGVDGPQYDRDLAVQLVDEVKAEGQWDGSLRLAYLTASEDEAIAIQAMLEDVGFQIVQEPLPSSQEQTQRINTDRDFEAAVSSLGIDSAAIWPTLGRITDGGPRNFLGYTSPEWEAGLDELRAAATVDEQRAALATLQEVWNRDVPAVILGSTEETIVNAPELRGLTYSRDAVVMFNDAYLED